MQLDHRQILDHTGNSGVLHFLLQLVRDPLQALLLGRRHASLRAIRDGILQDQVCHLLDTGPLDLYKFDLLLVIFKLLVRSYSMFCTLSIGHSGTRQRTKRTRWVGEAYFPALLLPSSPKSLTQPQASGISPACLRATLPPSRPRMMIPKQLAA